MFYPWCRVITLLLIFATFPSDAVKSLRSTARETDLQLFFVTDCTAHQKWMAFNVFNSAMYVGQKDPITWVRSGCTSDQVGKETLRAQALYPNAHVMDVLGYDGKSKADFNMQFGVPKAVNHFLSNSDKLLNSTVLALIEADFFFLSPLRLDDLNTKGLPTSGGRSLVQVDDASFVGGKVGVAQHYLCCDNLGPPYIMSAASWRELSPHWSKATIGGGWGADQQAFANAARAVGIKFNIFDHFMISDIGGGDGGPGEAWPIVREMLATSSGDVCATKKIGLQPGLDRAPTFLHVVRPWMVHPVRASVLSKAHRGNASTGSQAWGFSKYQVPPGWKTPQTTDGILECGMPLFAEPPATLLKTSDNRLQGWAICTIIHTLNSMLLNYKKVSCPSAFNEAKALKMNVPLEWSNSLVSDVNPKGVSTEWVKQCVGVYGAPKC